MSRAQLLIGAAVWSLWLSSCRSQASRELEAEALRLGRRIDALRDAPNEGKPALLGALSKTACDAERACELKRTCLDGYTRLLGALAASARARSLLALPDGGLGASIEAAQEVSRAELELERAKELTDRCASLQAALLRLSRKR